MKALREASATCNLPDLVPESTLAQERRTPKIASTKRCLMWRELLQPGKDVVTHEVLDCCHASHHISGELASLGLEDQERLPLYREQRTALRNGHWRQFVDQLIGLADEQPDNTVIRTEIAYLTKHGDLRSAVPFRHSARFRVGNSFS
jgi:hypothetical protein